MALGSEANYMNCLWLTRASQKHLDERSRHDVWDLGDKHFKESGNLIRRKCTSTPNSRSMFLLLVIAKFLSFSLHSLYYLFGAALTASG